ncbi:hypothetical protein CgunFtcFv8_007481 [Champsocephalus gunnari]|uniref:Uncharacterized protein n=1 Tax=Champsocephalus gunnari TaxID=52237 RepID=A0AAN8CHI1_CHAGU|nr:hypothetical protein CgunFtcFv8_007481 [Champsocephalus gunnari]
MLYDTTLLSITLKTGGYFCLVEIVSPENFTAPPALAEVQSFGQQKSYLVRLKPAQHPGQGTHTHTCVSWATRLAVIRTKRLLQHPRANCCTSNSTSCRANQERLCIV